MTPSPWTNQGGSQTRPVKTSTATRDNARADMPTPAEQAEHAKRLKIEAERRAEEHRRKERGPSLVERILAGDCDCADGLHEDCPKGGGSS